MSKIVIYHLSDMHIEKSEDTKVVNVKRICEVLNAVSDYDGILIIISGDIAFSGKHEEYNVSFKMVRDIKRELIKISGGKFVQVLVAPGNHDVDLSTDRGSEMIEKAINSGAAELLIDEEISKQRNYLNFAKGLCCRNDSEKILSKVDLQKCGVGGSAFLIDTAIFSTLGNDKGLHYLPESIIREFNNEQSSKCSIAIMHHSVHWFHESVKQSIEDFLLKKCKLVFYGHEHNIGTRNVEKDGYKTLFLAGGELCNKGNWDKSEFYLDIWDTQAQTFLVNKYCWNVRNQRYEKRGEDTYNLKCEEKYQYKYDEEFQKSLYMDEVNSISDNIFDYFVFPALERVRTNSNIETKIIKTQDEFFEEVLLYKKLAIFGGDNAGKTVLLKNTFLRLNQEKLDCLYCNVSGMNQINMRTVIQTIFRQNYQDHDGEFDNFIQKPKEMHAICVDGLHSLEKYQANMLLQKLEEFFDIIIYSTKEVVELDPAERFKQSAEISLYYQYKILPFYADKRAELIRKIIELKYNENEEENAQLAERIEETLKSLRKMYSMNPAFVIQSVDYFCKNFKDNFVDDGNVFSKVFESNLVNAIRPYAKGMTVEKILVLLDEIAYWSYKNRISAIEQSRMCAIIDSYNELHGDTVDYAKFINICQDARILRPIQGGGKYRFIDKNRLAYFIARQIIRLWNDKLDNSDLKELVRYIKYGINSNIILFVTYLTDNMYLIRSIIDDTFEYTKSWLNFDVKNVNIPYLASINGTIEVKAPSSNDKKAVEEKEKEREKREIEEYENNQVVIKDYFDYSTDDSEEILNQIIRGLSLLDIVSKCLPGFEHRMNKEDKEKVMRLIYELPSKIFYMWAMLVETEKEELLEFFLNEYRAVYLKPQDWDSVKKEDMLRYLQVESITLLLDVMNLSINNSVKEHTFQYFKMRKYDIELHQLEYLMALTKMDVVNEVEKYLHIVDDSCIKTIPDYMKKRIIKNYLIKSKKLSSSKVQQLLNEYFPRKTSNNDYRNILISREKTKRKQ